MEFIIKVAKFGIVGFIGMCIDFFVTWLLKEKFRVNKYVANSIGFTCAVINNFYLNLKWTFQTNGQNTNIYLIKFILISIIGLGLNNMFIYIFNERFSVNFYVSKALAVLCVFVWNFSANNYFNFHG
ncbi:MAG: GtrA family protein [Parafilimonas sp.]